MIDENTRDIIITSCCHSVNLLIQKYFPAELPYLAVRAFPYAGALQGYKETHIPTQKPCSSDPASQKRTKRSIMRASSTRCLRSTSSPHGSSPKISSWKQEIDANGNSRARFFPTTGGILKTLSHENPSYTYMAIDGTENCICRAQGYRKRKTAQMLYRDVCLCPEAASAAPLWRNSTVRPSRIMSAVARLCGKS